jgi:hypothetical protein
VLNVGAVGLSEVQTSHDPKKNNKWKVYSQEVRSNLLFAPMLVDAKSVGCIKRFGK